MDPGAHSVPAVRVWEGGRLNAVGVQVAHVSHQKMNFKPNCMDREGLAVEVIVPVVG